MEFYLIQTFTTAARPHFAEALRLVQDTASAEEEAHLTVLSSAEAFARAARNGSLRDAVLLFAAQTDTAGMDADTLALLRFLHLHEKEQLLTGSRAGILIDGENDLFTKDLGSRIAFAASLCGCALPGKPLVESASDLHSFTVLASLWQIDRYAAYLKSCRLLVEKLRTFAPVQITRPKILAVHAGNHKTSNSLSLWQLTAAALADKAEIEEISLRNGQIWDCRGCKYEDCLHFGEQGDCFYGGVMTEKVYPAIIKSDVVVLICPNYNDSVSANIMAFINRLTSVFRVNDFSAKRVYAIIVSGYSGGDLVAQQIIGAMNMNKNMLLPPRFALLETANAPGEALQIPGIKEKAANFAASIVSFPDRH